MRNRAMLAKALEPHFEPLALLLALLLLATAASAEDLIVESEGGPPMRGAALTLHEVLDSVERTYPLLLAAEVERVRAGSVLTEARGAYDTRLRATGEARPTEYYDRYTADIEVDQQTRLWGSRVYAGYRIGKGDFPSYLAGRKTNDSGELRAGVEIPLLKDGFIDKQRTDLRTSEIGTDLAGPEIELKRISIVREASESYWRWVAKGLSVDVERRLLSVAELRGDQLEGQVRNGAIPRIVLVDNQRLIVDRKIRLRGARQAFLDASFDLSLYLRSDTGEMIVPDAERLPPSFPPEDAFGEEKVRRDIERAQESHPRLQQLRLLQQDIEARLALARNGVLPDANLRIEGSHDLGSSSGGIDSDGDFSDNPKDGAEIAALLKFEVPVLQRGARGRVTARRAELTRLQHEARFARDMIKTEILRASTNVATAFDQTYLARENLDLANQLQTAEERKLSLGSSNLINVNIREIQTTDAARQLILAQAAYFNSRARYEAAIASFTEVGTSK